MVKCQEPSVWSRADKSRGMCSIVSVSARALSLYGCIAVSWDPRVDLKRQRQGVGKTVRLEIDSASLYCVVESL